MALESARSVSNAPPFSGNDINVLDSYRELTKLKIKEKDAAGFVAVKRLGYDSRSTLSAHAHSHCALLIGL